MEKIDTEWLQKKTTLKKLFSLCLRKHHDSRKKKMFSLWLAIIRYDTTFTWEIVVQENLGNFGNISRWGQYFQNGCTSLFHHCQSYTVQVNQSLSCFKTSCQDEFSFAMTTLKGRLNMIQICSKYAKDRCSTWQVRNKFHAFLAGWGQNQATGNLPTKREAWWEEILQTQTHC